MTTVIWRDAAISLDPDGGLTVVRDGLTYLAGWRPASVVPEGRGPAQPLAPPVVETLPDEVELRWRLPSPTGDLVLTGRHSFSAVWSQRWVLRNLRTDPVGPLVVPLRSAVPDPAVCWAFCAGVESSVSIQPYHPRRPVLGMATQRGALQRRPDAVALGPCALAPGEAYVVELRCDFYRDAATFGRTVHRWLPPSTYLRAGEVVAISHPDAALVGPAPAGAAGTSELGGSPVETPTDPLPADPLPADQVLASVGSQESEFVEDSGGERLLTFHDARGRTELTLHWAKPLDAVVGEAARAALAGRTVGNGTPILPDVQAGLLVQRALAGHAELDPDLAADALDLLASRPGEPSPWQVMFDCAEYHRTGEDDQLIRAHGTFLRSQPRPGTGLAASRLVVALLSVGRDPVPVLQRLQAARDRVADHDVHLELTLVAGTVFGAGHTADAAEASVRQLAEVAVRLGSGLRGTALPELAPVERARLVTLLSLLPELAGAVQDRLAVGPGALAQYAANRVLYDLAVGPDLTAADRQALVWLSLAGDT